MQANKNLKHLPLHICYLTTIYQNISVSIACISHEGSSPDIQMWTNDIVRLVSFLLKFNSHNQITTDSNKIEV